MGASEGTSPLGGGGSPRPRDTRECHCHPPRAHGSSLRLRARSMRRPARPRDRARGCPPPAAGVAQILTRARARVDAKYVTEVERRSEMATDAADARAPRTRRGASATMPSSRETRGTRDADRTRGAPTRPSDVRKRVGRARRFGDAAETGAQAEALAARAAVRSRNETPPKHAARAAERARARTGGGGDRARRPLAGRPHRERGRAERAAEALALALSAAAAVAEAREAEARRDAETMRRDTDDERSRLERRLEAARGENAASRADAAASAAAEAAEGRVAGDFGVCGVGRGTRDAAETETRRATARYATLVAELEVRRARDSRSLSKPRRAPTTTPDARRERFRNRRSGRARGAPGG